MKALEISILKRINLLACIQTQFSKNILCLIKEVPRCVLTFGREMSLKQPENDLHVQVKDI